MKLLLIFLIATSFIYADTEPYYVTTPSFITVGGVADHGFDDELESNAFPEWTFSGSGTFIREEYREYDGASYAIIDATTSGDNYFYQDLSVSDIGVDKNYILSFRYKILDDDLTVATGGDGPLVKVQVEEFSGWVDIAVAKGEPDETGDNWMTAKVGFTAPSSDLRLCVGVWDAYGTLAIDDVRINVMNEDDYAELNNPDLERWGTTAAVPYDWTAVTAGGTVTTTDAETFSGKYAMELERTTSGTTKCYQELDLNPKTHYEGRIYVKTDDVGLNGARFEITDVVGFSTVTLFESDDFTGDSGWLSIPFDFTTGATADDVKFEAILSDTGTAYFDGIFLRRDPIMIGDFEDSSWITYWVTESGGNSIPNIVLDGSNSVLEIYNDSEGDTAVYQDIDVIAGIPMLFSGEINTDITSIGDDGGGAFVQLIDNGSGDIVDEDGPFDTDEDWDLFSLSASAGTVENYRIRFVLENASGVMQMDDVGVYSPSVNDIVTIIPQPASVDRISRNITETIGGASSESWNVIYMGGMSVDVNDTRCATDLEFDLEADETTANHDHYFHITSGVEVGLLNDPTTPFIPTESSFYPAIIISQATNADADVQTLMNWVGVSAEEVAALGDEGYYLISTDYNVDGEGDTESFVLILSDTEKGRYYGTQTYLQLLEIRDIPVNWDGLPTTDTVYYMPGVEIYDKPELPIRAVHIPLANKYLGTPGEQGFSKYEYQHEMLKVRPSEMGDDDLKRTPLEAYIRLLSRMKINMLIIDSPLFYCLDDTTEYIDHDDDDNTDALTNLEVLKLLFKYCRDYYIEPVPLMQSLGHAKKVLQFEYDDEMGTAHKNWLEVEACWVGDPDADENDPIPVPQPLEKFTENNHTFEHPFVVKTSGRPIKVYYLNYADEIVRELGSEEYTINYTEPEFDINQGYNFDNASPRLEDNLNCSINITGTLPEKYDKWAVEYHFINLPRLPHPQTYDNNIKYSYCPTSSVIKNFMKEQIKNVVEEPELRPRYIHFGHDEPWQMNTCERCRNVVPAPGVTAPGQLFADSVNYLVDEYEDACDTYNVDDPRVIIWADHVSYPHEIFKVTDWKGQGYYDWWHYRGATSSKRVSTCKSVIDKSVIANDWNYKYETRAPGEQFLKYQYIEDLTEAGFDVLGANAGYSDYDSGAGVDPWGGAAIYARLYYPKEGVDWPFDIYLSAFEGTMDQNLPLYKHKSLGFPHFEKNDEQYWFNRHIHENCSWFWTTININPDDIDPGGHVNSVIGHLDMRGKSVQGEAWFDDITIEFKDEGADNWDTLINENTNNGDFESLAPRADTFSHWSEADLSRAECFADSIIHRDDGVGNDNLAMRYEVNQVNTTKFEDPVKNATDISGIQGTIDPPNGGSSDDRIKLKGYTRTREVDTLRLGCPLQWRREGAGFEQAHVRGDGEYIGGVKASWYGYYLPLDEDTKVQWKNHAPDSGVADWNWSKEYPQTPYLKDSWWDPFVMYIKEVTW